MHIALDPNLVLLIGW